MSTEKDSLPFFVCVCEWNMNMNMNMKESIWYSNGYIAPRQCKMQTMSLQVECNKTNGHK